jgi:hypothetical protein
MRGAIPPLPQYVFIARYLVKHRDFTFTFMMIPPFTVMVNGETVEPV